MYTNNISLYLNLCVPLCGFYFILPFGQSDKNREGGGKGGIIQRYYSAPKLENCQVITHKITLKSFFINLLIPWSFLPCLWRKQRCLALGWNPCWMTQRIARNSSLMSEARKHAPIKHNVINNMKTLPPSLWFLYCYGEWPAILPLKNRITH